MESNKRKRVVKFADDFVPTFSASRLGDICGNQSEYARIKLLRHFKPFSEIRMSSSCDDLTKAESNTRSKIYKSTSLLAKEDKEFLKSRLEKSINTTDLTFNDEQVLGSFRLKIDSNSEDEEKSRSNPLKRTHSEMDPSKAQQAARYISCLRGRKLEDHILAKINRERNADFEKNKKKTIVDFGLFKIVGIIDGISVQTETILEIKTRNRFNKEKETITSKERKQALTYMKMHDCDSCLFVELGPGGDTKETVLEWNEDEFNREVLQKLNEFCLYARNFTEEQFKELLDKYQIN